MRSRHRLPRRSARRYSPRLLAWRVIAPFRALASLVCADVDRNGIAPRCIRDSGSGQYALTIGPKSKDEIRRNMSAIRSRDNRTEVALRRAIHARGLRFRLHPQRVIGKPDIVFPREMVAVFIDGDYWHARLLREKGLGAVRERLRPENESYWVTKFTRRVERDDEVTAALSGAGWVVIRLWESEVKRDLTRAVDEVVSAVSSRRRERR
ncbi:MAG: very short patch repair endonuclease [Sphingomonas sp.]|nr:very short patch repair endonuclease [Sphingomonas sp.]